MLLFFEQHLTRRLDVVYIIRGLPEGHDRSGYKYSIGSYIG